MALSDAPAPCPAGHDETVKLLPLVAVGGRAAPTPAPAAAPMATGGGCCGGSCGCG